jgi:alkylglycerol monooxygenase
MEINLWAFVVPVALLFIGLEFILSLKQGKSYFKFDSTVSNINIGIIERLTDLITSGSFYFFYAYLHSRYAIFDIKPKWWVWILLLLATDFLWYWYHRFGHRINLMWGFHIVHHSSEEFNLSTGTRITIFQAVIRTLFWSALPVIGFPAEMIMTILLIHGAYPFFTHTQTIGKLGWIEYILVTPSHHRVHHASNESYLDKNYGDIFIFWDKIFGTFAEEKEEAVYGITQPLKSHSVLWQHFHHLAEIWLVVKEKNGWLNKLKVIFGKPKEHSQEIRNKAEKLFLSRHKIKSGSKHHRGYVLLQMGLILFILFVLILLEKQISLTAKYGMAAFLFVSVLNVGAILEQRRWIFDLEIIRLLILLIVCEVYVPHALLIAVLSIFFIYPLLSNTDLIKKLKINYLKKIYGDHPFG